MIEPSLTKWLETCSGFERCGCGSKQAVMLEDQLRNEQEILVLGLIVTPGARRLASKLYFLP
jgi:hypothetical protein